MAKISAAGCGPICTPTQLCCFVTRLEPDSYAAQIQSFSSAPQCHNEVHSPDAHPSDSLQGYGTVRFMSEADVQRAIQEFSGYELEGRNLTVKVDQYA